jgi:cellulose synthase (UDP-forming)
MMTLTGKIKIGICAASLLLLSLMALVPTTGRTEIAIQISVFAALFAAYLADQKWKKYSKTPWIRIAIILLPTALTFRYLSWRISETLPYGYGWVNLIIGCMLLGSEFHGIISSLLGQISNVMPLDRRAVPYDRANPPTVDILVPTFNEDPGIVETTIIAATQMNYRADRLKVYILDDGGTTAKCAQPGERGLAAQQRAAALKDIAARWGAIYLTRADNCHAKAGNINSALTHVNGDLVMILDCDHVPARDFLERTVGFFGADEKLFLVQTPHNFISADPVERNLRTSGMMPAENELFYSVMQPGLDFWGASYFCGSAAVLRRKVLDEIGGISGKSITEDAETTVKAMSLGYKTFYYNRPMVSGLQPETFSGFILQRVRWAQGMIQIFLLDNVWTKRGMTFMQKVLFTNFAFYWLFPIARIAMLAIPPLFLIFGVTVAVTPVHGLLVFALPYYFATVINTQYFYGRVRWPFISQIYEIAQSIFLAMGIYQVLRHPTSPTFKVTPKGEFLEENFISKLIWPFYFMAAVQFVSIAVGAWRLMTEPQIFGNLLLVGAWVFLDAMAICTVIGALSEHRQTRSAPRAYRRVAVRVTINGLTSETKTHDMSRYGMALLYPHDLGVRRGDKVEIEFQWKKMRLHGEVKAVGMYDGNPGIGVGCQFETPAQERFMVDMVFGNSKIMIGRLARRHGGKAAFASLCFMLKLMIYGILTHWHLVSGKWRQRRAGKAVATPGSMPTGHPVFSLSIGPRGKSALSSKRPAARPLPAFVRGSHEPPLKRA